MCTSVMGRTYESHTGLLLAAIRAQVSSPFSVTLLAQASDSWSVSELQDEKEG